MCIICKELCIIDYFPDSSLTIEEWLALTSGKIDHISLDDLMYIANKNEEN